MAPLGDAGSHYNNAWYVPSIAGFMINFCTVLLTFCKPFFSRFVSAPKLDLISLDYPSSPVCRLDHINVTCLASGTIGMC